jgi:5-methylcytosine-specific restriction endonuclease McrA
MDGDRHIKRTKIFTSVLEKVKSDNINKYGVLTCEICKQQIEHEIYHFDHIIPVSRYSKKRTPFRMNGVRNLQITCERCNLKKSNKIKKVKFKTL